MNHYAEQHAIYERLSSLEQRMKTVEHTLDLSTADMRDMRDDLKKELSRQSEELAMTRQAVRIFEDVARGLESQLRTLAAESVERIRGIAAENKEIMTMLQDHLLREAGDKVKVLIGLATAGATGIGTLGILIWGVMQVVQQQ